MQHDPLLIEKSTEIAWDYLHLAGELEDNIAARRFLLAYVEALFAQGVRSRLLLSNRAITAYQQLKHSRRAA